MLLLRKSEANIFHDLPVEIFDQIMQATGKRDITTPIFDYDEYKTRHEHSDIAKALKHAAYARKEDVASLLAMLNDNPHLLLVAGNVMTPGGLYCIRVTIYEFLLGAGDPDLAAQVQPYFSKIPNGINECKRQYERYLPHIESMLTQKLYDITPLISTIKQSSADDDFAFDHNQAHKSALHDAADQFKNDFAPSILIKPRMHFNHARLQNMRMKFFDEWDNLFRASNDSFTKLRVLWRLISFTLRRLPGVDRCVMAQGLYNVVEKNEWLERSYKLRISDGGFPVTVEDDFIEGLGFDISCYDHGGAHDGNDWRDNNASRGLIGKLMSSKHAKLIELMLHQPRSKILYPPSHTINC